MFWRFSFSSKFHFKTPHDLDSQSDYSYVVDCGKPLIFIKKNNDDDDDDQCDRLKIMH